MSKRKVDVPNGVPNHVRQGDVLVIDVLNAPKELGAEVPREDGAVVLAHGEVTGHKHAFWDDSTYMYSNDSVPGATKAMPARLLKIVEPTAFKHDEHKQIPVDKGVKRVIRQVEYTPAELRRVAD